MSQLIALIPFASIVALALHAGAYAHKRAAQERPIGKATWFWALHPLVVPAFFVLWGLRGLVEGSNSALVLGVTCTVAVIGSVVSLRRDDIWQRIDSLGKVAQRVWSIVLTVLLVVFTFLCVEAPFNALLPCKGPSYFWLEMILLALALRMLYYLGQRKAGFVWLGVLFFSLAGVCQHFIMRFKNAAILPNDILALRTAIAVGGEYVFSTNEQIILALCFPLLALCVCSLIRPPRKGAHEKTGTTVARNLGMGVATFAVLVATMFVPNYMDHLGIKMEYWYSIDYYQQQGYLPTFIAVWQDMPIKKPEGYSDDAAKKLTASYADTYRKAVEADKNHQKAAAQFDKLKPSVIAIMNESFADLSIYDGMHAGYEGPQFFKNGFGDALAQGTLNVSVHGAGTCNSEFEFLTGNSLTYIGAGKYPYSVYDLSKVDAIAGQFKSLGYQTCAIHPNYASNWNRDKVYPLMGFQTFLDIDDFGGMPNCAVDKQTPNEPHCEVFHSGVSDIATYDRILKLLEESDEPQFVFDVTMANHGSYNQKNIPDDYLTNYQPSDYVGHETPERLNEYLSCIKKSDDDLKVFVEKLRKLDRPVVLVFFGDHQPSVSLPYNDYWYKNEPEGLHARRAFSTNYVVWANYDVAGREQTGQTDETSADMLISQTLDLIGAPVSDYQAAQLAIRSSIPALSTKEYQGQDRTWYALGEGPYAKEFRDMSMIEYLNFARKV